MRPGEIDEIRKLPLFAAMLPENFDALFRGAYVQNFPPQIELIREGDPADFLHVVLEGSVELFATWNNRETTMATVAPIATENGVAYPVVWTASVACPANAIFGRSVLEYRSAPCHT